MKVIIIYSLVFFIYHTKECFSFTGFVEPVKIMFPGILCPFLVNIAPDATFDVYVA